MTPLKRLILGELLRQFLFTCKSSLEEVSTVTR
jgi:hypothetical protein